MDCVVYMVNFDMVGSYILKQVVYVLGVFKGSLVCVFFDGCCDVYLDFEVMLGVVGCGLDYQLFCDFEILYFFFWMFDVVCDYGVCDIVDCLVYVLMVQIVVFFGELVVGFVDSEVDFVVWCVVKGCRLQSSVGVCLFMNIFINYFIVD